MGNSNNKEEKKERTVLKSDKKTLKTLDEALAGLYKYKCEHKINDNGSVTFYPTPDCKSSEEPFQESKSATDAINAVVNDLYCKDVLAWAPNTPVIKHEDNNICSFITSAITSWSKHYPFRFKPEHIWLLILQGVAIHVEQNAEKLRSKYVQHDDKMLLKLYVSANISAEEWINIIKGFVDQIDKNTVNDTCELFDCDFTCSTLTEKIAAKVTIMDICKSYFDYKCITLCGFPEITLDGTKEDWVKLRMKTSTLLKNKVDKKFGKQWGDALLPLLDRFIDAFDGNIDCVFWNSMIKRGAVHGSGGDGYMLYTGWFNILFPFIKERWNRYCVPYSMDKKYVKQGFKLDGNGQGVDMDLYPNGLATAPVIWDRLGVKLKLKFIAGFVGFKQDEKTMEITPNVSWMIATHMNEQEMNEKKVMDRAKPPKRRDLPPNSIGFL